METALWKWMTVLAILNVLCVLFFLAEERTLAFSLYLAGFAMALEALVVIIAYPEQKSRDAKTGLVGLVVASAFGEVAWAFILSDMPWFYTTLMLVMSAVLFWIAGRLTGLSYVLFVGWRRFRQWLGSMCFRRT